MFKVGDKVVCINARESLIRGHEYIISRVHGMYVGVYNHESLWGDYRFKKVNEMKIEINSKAKPKAKTKTSPKPVVEAYYVRHKPSGHGVSLSANYNSKVQIPATLIATYSDAVNEANRLAELHAGSEFVILGVVYKVKKVPVYTTEAQEYTV